MGRNVNRNDDLMPEIWEPESSFSSYYNLLETPNLPAGISARRPEISLRASAQREVESAIMLTLYPMSLKYSERVIPAENKQSQYALLVCVFICILTHVSDQRVFPGYC